MSHQLKEYQQTKLLLIRKYMEITDLAESINEEKYMLTCEIEKLNQLISAEEAALENNPS